MTEYRRPQANPTEQGCRRAAWLVAAALAALAGCVLGIVLWAILSAALILVLVVGAILASAGHSPGAGNFDFPSQWRDLFTGGWVYAALIGAVVGAVCVGSARSLVRWIRWRRRLRPLFKADPTLRAQLLLPVFCKMVFALDLLLCLVHLFLVTCGLASGLLDDFPTLRMLVFVGLLAGLLGVLSDILLLSGRPIAAVLGCLAALATLGSIAVHGAGVVSGPREPVHLAVLMFLILGLRIAWLAVFVWALFRFWCWARRPRPDVPAVPAT
jgi:hypothetical protein